MDSMKLVVVIITIVFAIIKATKHPKSEKKSGKSVVNQTIQRAATASKTTTEYNRPTQQHETLAQAANSVNKVEARNKPQSKNESRPKNKPQPPNKSNIKPLEKGMDYGHKVAPASEVPCAESMPEKRDILMQEIQDLMVKGYDGRLTFERDFISEGMEMLNRIQLQSEV